MAQTHRFDHQVKSSIETAFSSVLDMRVWGKHHPYFKQVTLVQQTPEFTEFNIREFVWVFGILPQWPNYNAKVFEKEKHKHIQYTSTVKGGIFLTIDFHFSNHTDNTTLVTEQINITGSDFVGKVLLGAMKKTHPIIFEKLGS